MNLETNCQSFKGRKIYQVVGLGEGRAAPHREDAGAGLQGCKGFAKGERAGARLWAAWAAEQSKGREDRHEASSPRVVSPPRGAGETGEAVGGGAWCPAEGGTEVGLGPGQAGADVMCSAFGRLLQRVIADLPRIAGPHCPANHQNCVLGGF